MKSKKQYSVEKAFLKEPWKHLTYSEIQKISQNKSKSYIYGIIGKLKKENKIIEEKIGKRAIVYLPKLDSALSQSYWGGLSEKIAWEQSKVPVHIIENIRAKLGSLFFILLVTGSYARGTSTRESDLDIVIISNQGTMSIYSELKHEAETSIPKVHLYAFNEKEFLEMLARKKENYGREIARNNLLFFGGSCYYSLLSEAISHGFKG